MDLIQAVFLGLLQGVFEWLPVSSQGQVMGFALAFLSLSAGQALRIAVFLHLGTLFAALFYFRSEMREILLGEKRELRKFLLIALLSTAITGIPLFLLLKFIVESFNPAFLLLIIGLLLVSMALVQHKKKLAKKTSLNPKNAFFLGLGQGLSVLPGVSRSGITTSVLLFEGFKPEQAFKLSFLLSVPSVFLAEIGYGLMEGFAINLNSLAGLMASAIAGFVFISILLKTARKLNFSLFCYGFGVLYVLLALFWVF